MAHCRDIRTKVDGCRSLGNQLFKTTRLKYKTWEKNSSHVHIEIRSFLQPTIDGILLGQFWQTKQVERNVIGTQASQPVSPLAPSTPTSCTLSGTPGPWCILEVKAVRYWKIKIELGSIRYQAKNRDFRYLSILDLGKIRGRLSQKKVFAWDPQLDTGEKGDLSPESSEIVNLWEILNLD